MAQNNLKSILEGHHYVPVVTFNKGDDPMEFCDFLMQKKVNCIEVTLRTPYAMEAITILKKNCHRDFEVGVGTVCSSDQVKAVSDLGVDFMVSPGLTVDLIRSMEESGIAYLPGVATPSEIIKAKEMGLNALKFFPASLFGGIEALKTYSQVFPEIIFCPTGGINKMSSTDYLKLSNVFAVGGSWFQKSFQSNLEA